MKTLKTAVGVAALALAAAVLLNPPVQAAAASGQQQNDPPSLVFAKEADGATRCTVPYETGDYNFIGEDPELCTNDEMSYFKLQNVPSASQFWLEKRECHESGGWVVRLSVFKNPTSTDFIPIPSLKGRQEGEIIVAGLRLEEKKEIGDDDLKGELSCVRIKRSELP